MFRSLVSKLLVLLLFISLLGEVSLGQQEVGGVGGGGGATFTGLVANLPATCVLGQFSIVTDANALDDCSTGLGSLQNVCLCDSSNNWLDEDAVGSGSGDNVSVNGTSVTDMDLDDADPAAPANAANVTWQLNAVPAPDSVSAYINWALMASVSRGDGTAGSFTTTFNVSGTDTVVTHGSNVFNISTGLLQEGGNEVPNDTDTLDFFSATTSAELASIISNETGSVLLVFSTSPTLTTPIFAGATVNGGDLDFDDGVTDSPKAIFTPATGTVWNIFVEDATDDWRFEANTASTENVEFINTGAGIVAVFIETSNGVLTDLRDAAHLVTGTVLPARVGADHIDAMTEIATGIKLRADDVDTKIVTTAIATPAGNECAEIDSNGSLVLTGAACITTVGDSITVNGSATTNVDLDDTDPVAPANGTNVLWQLNTTPSPDSVSAYINWDLVETITRGDGISASFIDTFDVSGTDTAVTHGSNVWNLSIGIMQEGGVNVVVESLTLTGGAGIGAIGDLSTNRTIVTASGETDFLANGALTCGANTEGRAQVHTTPLQYCDNAATPALQYAAYGDSSGDATGVANSVVDLTTDVTGDLPVPEGGTGVSTLADGGFVLGSGAGAVTVTAQPTNGQLPIGSTGGDPVLAAITGGTEVTVVLGPGTITINGDYTPSSVDTNTNKTQDAEATGNNFTEPIRIMLRAGGVVGGTAAVAWNTAASGHCEILDKTAGGFLIAAVACDKAADESIGQFTTKLPPVIDVANVDLIIQWYGETLAVNEVTWAVRTACLAATGEAISDLSWNATKIVTSTASGTADDWASATIDNVPMTNCAGGETLWVEPFRDADASEGGADDDFDEDAIFVQAELIIRVTK